MLLIDLLFLSHPTNAGDVLKFAFHVSNFLRSFSALTLLDGWQEGHPAWK